MRPQGVHWVCRNVTFNQDVRVNVFELSASLARGALVTVSLNCSCACADIRVLGGLLSAHYLADDPDHGLMPDYDGCLLDVALDVGQRMLPAFDSSTGLPRVSLLSSV
jgi:hypothetical protein|eukprot:COSAG01_NODE_21455_length_901_cov_1.428928_2_plen_108_part_00